MEKKSVLLLLSFDQAKPGQPVEMWFAAIPRRLDLIRVGASVFRVRQILHWPHEAADKPAHIELRLETHEGSV